MPRTSKLLAAFLILAALGCHKPKPGDPPHSKVGVAVAPPPGQTVNYDPSVIGLGAAIGTTVYDSQGVILWLKYGAPLTAWRAVPVSPLVTGDPSQAPGLKAPIGFTVTMNDGSASWVKKTSSDTGWVANPPTGGGGGINPDGGIAPPLFVDGGVLGVKASSPDASGSMSAADKAKLNGINPVGWSSQMYAFIQTIIPGQVNDFISSEFCDPGVDVDITQGDHPGIVLPAANGCLIEAPHGNTGLAYIAFHGQTSQSAVNTSANAPISNTKTRAWGAAFRLNLALAPSGGTNIWLGMWAPDSSEHETWVGIKGGVSTTVFQQVSDNVGSLTTTAGNAACTVGSGITIGSTASTAFNVELIYDLTNGVLSSYVNEVLCTSTSVLTNLPTTSGVMTWFISTAQHGVLADASLIAFSRGP